MSTVLMKKGDLYAKIYDSEETIAQAMYEGYQLVKDEPKAEPEKATENVRISEQKPKTAKPKAKKTTKK